MQLVAEDLAKVGQYETARKLIKLLRIRFPDEQSLLVTETVLAAKLNDFETAAANKVLLKPETLKTLPDADQALLQSVDQLQGHFQNELAIREQEAEADDLPRVELMTTQGKVVIELFENQAPKTVANFIDLVEKNFYTQVYFHQVINELVAEAGLVRPGGMVGVDYTIPDEREESTSRRNFRGTVSMVSSGKPNSSSTRFAILLIPAPHLDFDPKDPEKPGQTVFGRVISGMQSIDRFTRTLQYGGDDDDELKLIEGAVPDQILSATVIRKRDHVYEPEKLMRQ